jgi:hypothetical protein
MKRWILWGVLALLIFAGGAWIANRMIRAANAEPAAMAKGLPDSVETPPSKQMQEQLMDPLLDEAARESLMEKIEIAKNIEQQQSAGAIPPAPKVPPDFGPEALVMAQPQVESGIFPGPEAMIWPSLMRISNYWQGLVDGEVVMIFAGSSADDPRQGLVVIATTSADPAVGDIRFERLPAPGQTGSLRVASESGGILTLETPEGVQLTFSIAAKSFGP